MPEAYAVEVALNISFSCGVLTYAWERTEPPVVGLRVQVPFRDKKLKGVIIRVLRELPETPYTLKLVSSVLDSKPILGTYTLELSQWLANFCLCTLGEALSFMLPWAVREKALPTLSLTLEDIPPFDLNTEQKAAQATILNASASTSFYLEGVTGSGKSETLIHTAQEVLNRGQSVLYLVPEITLSYSLLKSLQRVITEHPLFVLHSGLTASEQLAQWRAIREVPVCCVIGVRSATFAPFHNLGLIVMDEEQESSYKSESSPRYYTRHLIFLLQKHFQSTVVLTSATPSLESYQAIQLGILTSLKLTQRVGEAYMPQVKVVHLTNTQDLISPELAEALLNNLKAKKQAILFLNRRGFLSVFHCRDCGHQKVCPHCSVPLTYHKSLNCLRCHYCDHSEPILTGGMTCSECGSFPMQYAKIGTEFVEETLKAKFPHMRIVRLDTDVSGENRLKPQEILSQFEAGEWDVLLGTQMIAKGLNFRHVELVGLILADSTLSLPDFRAYEKTYALIRQVIGRAGRFSQTGQVILQTLQPEHPVIQLACDGQDETFYEQELAMRQAIDFPPFSRLFRLVLRGASPERVQSEAQRLFQILKEWKAPESSIEIYEPCECVIERIAGNWRWQILLKGQSLNRLHTLVSRSSTRWSSGAVRDLYLEIDPYPMNML